MIYSDRYGHLDSFLVIKSRVLGYEKYYNLGHKNTPHIIASVGKSIVSAQIGIAMLVNLQENIFKNLLELNPL